MPTPKPLENYRSYRGLPQLAGLCTVQEAARPGLAVEECVRRLKRFHYAFQRLHYILTARITSEPIYELKTGFSHHAYLCSEHVAALRQRVAEMREPPLGLEEVPHPALEAFFDEILATPTTAELLVGVYGVAVPSLLAAIQRYESDTNPLTDAPSRRVLRFARLELEDMARFGQQVFDALEETTAVQAGEWVRSLTGWLDAAGGLDGTAPPSPATPQRWHSRTPYQYDPIPRRDERFTDPWNQGVNAESFLYNETYPARAKALMMLYKRLREIDVPEMMASILVQTPGKPWEYYRDMTRQLWDEA